MGRKSQPYRDFLDAIASEDVTRRASALLAPLLAYDSERSGDLIHTLDVYFSLGGNSSRAAEALFLHRNGLLYRLARIEELLGVPLADAQVRLALEVALRADLRNSGE
jgi:DNA-binding PucR family transcriptional regulator